MNTSYGAEISPSAWWPLRSIVAEPEKTVSGNIVLRVGRENDDPSPPGWHVTEHVVLTPDEAREYLAKLSALIGEGQ